MATVNDEDREYVHSTYDMNVTMTQEYEMTAAYRERIEARKDAEHVDRVNALTSALSEKNGRIANLERDTGDFANAIGTAAGLRDVGFKAPEQIVEAVRAMANRVAELEKQLAATEAARDRAYDKVIDMGKRIAELEAQLAIEKRAAKVDRADSQRLLAERDELQSQLASAGALDHDWTVWAKALTGLVGVGGVAYREAIGARVDAVESARDHAISFQAANVARCERLEDALEKAEREMAAVREALHMEPPCKATPADLISDMEIDRDEWKERTKSWMQLAHEVTGIAKGQANMGMLQNAVRDKLAAAKPVLTAEEERACHGIESDAGHFAEATHVVARALRTYTNPCPPPKAPPSDEELADRLDNALTRQCNRRASMREVAEALRARGAK